MLNHHVRTITIINWTRRPTPFIIIRNTILVLCHRRVNTVNNCLPFYDVALAGCVANYRLFPPLGVDYDWLANVTGVAISSTVPWIDTIVCQWIHIIVGGVAVVRITITSHYLIDGGRKMSSFLVPLKKALFSITLVTSL